MPPAIDSLRHIVVLMLENRSFDPMLGCLKKNHRNIDGLHSNEAIPDSTGAGVEVTLEGPVEANDDSLLLTATSNRPSVRIMPLRSTDKVQLDQTNGVPNPLPVDEAEAYAELDKTLQTAGATAEFSITGPLLETDAGFVIEVRKFHQI